MTKQRTGEEILHDLFPDWDGVSPLRSAPEPFHPDEVNSPALQAWVAEHGIDYVASCGHTNRYAGHPAGDPRAERDLAIVRALPCDECRKAAQEQP